MIPAVGLELSHHTCRVSLYSARAEALVDVAGAEAGAGAATDRVLAAGRVALARALASRLGSGAGPVHIPALVCVLPFGDCRDGGVVEHIRSSLRGTSTCALYDGGSIEIVVDDVQVVPEGAAALVAQVYRLEGDERILVARADLLDQVVGVVSVGRSVSTLVFGKGLQQSERFSRVQPAAADASQQISALIGEYRNLLNIKSFVVAGEGAATWAPALPSTAPGVLVPSEPEWAGAEGGRLFAAMRLRLLRQQRGGGGQASG